jgi:hypothetical protein
MRRSMPALGRPLIAGLLGLAAAFLVACGDRNGLLSSSDANAIGRQLDSAQAALNSQSCARATAAANRAQQLIARLPARVDPRLRNRLNRGATRLVTLAARDCSQPQTTETQTETTTTQTETQTTQTETQTTTTPTETTTTPTETTTTPTTTQPPSTDNSGGNQAPGGEG